MDIEILFIGGSSVDLILKVPRIPLRDEKIVAEYVGHQAGGLVANAACAAARFGISTAWSGVIGDDENGQILLKSFTEFGVDTSLVYFDADRATDFTVILLDPSGERTILVVPTATSTPIMTIDGLRCVKNSDAVYTLPQEVKWFTSLANAVHEEKGRIVIDVEASAPVQGDDLLKVIALSDIVFCNRKGLEIASGTDDIDIGADKLLALGPECVCITLGKRGAFAATDDHKIMAQGYQVPVIDTTGAGDTFHAAFLAEYLEENDIDQSLRFANAAAAISVGNLGPRAGLPTRAEVADFMGTAIPGDA